jgi:hypothetical protein
MSKKLIWAIVVVVLLVVIGYGAYRFGSKERMDVNQAAKVVTEYLNQSQARAVEECRVWVTGGDYVYIDVGGKYVGVWDRKTGRLVGICSKEPKK